MDATFQYARFIKKTDYAALPREVVEITKKFILDTLGVAVAGSSAPGCPEVAEEMKGWGGRKDATLWIHGGEKVPAANATLVNAAMAHALDLDDCHDMNAHHAYNSVLSTALALAEMKGGVSGQKLLAAVALGVDISSRVGSACDKFYGWHPAAIYGVFGAAAAASKILDLTEGQTVDTFGIGYSQTGGSFQSNIDGALIKRMQPGLNARGAVLGAFLAQRGVTGPQDVLEGKCGFFQLYQRGTYDPRILTAELGERFEGVNVSIKPYPCCRCNHAAVDAALALARANRIGKDDIDHIDVEITAHCNRVTGKPFRLQGNAQVYAQFCIPYTVTASLLRKDLFIGDFEEAAIRDPQIEPIALKVHLSPDEEVAPSQPTVVRMAPATVKVTMKDGRVLSHRTDVPKGDPRNPMTYAEVVEKVKKCLPYSLYPLNEKRLQAGFEMIAELEKIDDVAKLIPCFCRQ